MTWFEAYMLWKLGAVTNILAISGGLLTAYCVIDWIIYGIEQESVAYHSSGEERNEAKAIADKALSRAKKVSAVFFPIAIFLWFIAVLVPSTTELLKIVATKKGVEILQSERVGRVGEKAGDIVENAMKLLNQTIEDKLNREKK